MNVYQSCAHQLHAMGLNVTAIVGGKKPGHTWKEFQEARQLLDQVNAFPWVNASGLGVISGVGGLRIFDFDEKRKGYPPVDFATVTTVLQKLELPTAYPWLWRSGSGNGWGLAVLCFEAIPTGVLSSNGNGPGVFEAPGVGFDHLELRWRDCQTLLPPSKHPEGPGYAWLNGTPTAPPATVTAAQVIAAFQAVTLRPQSAYVPPMKGNGHGSGYAAAALRAELETLGRATEGTRNETLNRCAFALGQLVAGGELDRGDVERELLSGALAIGLSEGEAAATIKSGLDAGSRDPRTAPAPMTKAHTYAPVSDEPPDWLDAASEPPAWLADDDLAEHLDKTPRPPATPKPDLSECLPLPESARLDPALGLDASPWLDAYVEFSRRWAPRAYDGFHEAVGLWVLSTVAGRRVKLDFGGERFPSLYVVNVARSSVWTKSTAHHIGAALLDACGLSFLLAPDESTPQALLARMSTPATVYDWDAKPADVQLRDMLRLAFAGHKGWSYDEFGQKVAGMMRDSGVMAEYRGILRSFFDNLKPRHVYETIGRGENAIDRPYLALLGSMTPADMGPYAKPGGALWSDGSWARFTFVAPGPEDQPTRGRFPPGARIFPAALLQPLRAWHDRLGVPAVDFVPRNGTDGKPVLDQGKKVFDVTVTPRPPEACTFGSGVEDAYYAYYDALTSLSDASNQHDLDANYSRFPEKALRVAMLLASLENRGVIELRHWARAQVIAERWRRNLHDLYRTLNAKESDTARNEDRVVEIVQRLGTATPVEVRRYAPDISTTEAASILAALAKAGALQVAEKTRKGTLRYSMGES